MIFSSILGAGIVTMLLFVLVTLWRQFFLTSWRTLGVAGGIVVSASLLGITALIGFVAYDLSKSLYYFWSTP
jgi:hypothetical protein